IADAVRQPTRLDQLVATCDGDEEGVREIVEAYRAPGCNFLLPEVDPQKPLGPATVIDISHESLIRQWTRLSEWLSGEAAAAQQWRRLIDRFKIGEPLRRRELANFIAWRREVRPNAAWADRYGGDYPSANAFLDRSEKAENRRYWFRWGGMTAVFAVVLSAAVFSFYQWRAATTSLAQAELHRASAVSSYFIARDILNNLVKIVAASRMPVSQVSEMFASVTSTLDRLRARDPDDAELAILHARVLETFADAYRDNAYHSLALNAAQDANVLFRRLADRRPDESAWLRPLGQNLDRIGDLKLKLADSVGAKAAYLEALGIDRSLMVREPDREDNQREIVLALVKLGDLSRAAPDVDG